MISSNKPPHLPHRGNLIDLTGERFGALTVKRRQYSDNKSRGNARWYCKCDCGAVVFATGVGLRKGSPTSCRDCARKERQNGNR